MKLFVAHQNNKFNPVDLTNPNNWDDEGGYYIVFAKDKDHAAKLTTYSIKDIHEVDMSKEAVIRMPYYDPYPDSPRGD